MQLQHALLLQDRRPKACVLGVLCTCLAERCIVHEVIQAAIAGQQVYSCAHIQRIYPILHV